MQSFNIGGCESCQGFKSDAFDRHIYASFYALHTSPVVPCQASVLGAGEAETFHYQLGVFWDSFLESFLSSVFAVFLLQKTR